jgi:hypothetical protein
MNIVATSHDFLTGLLEKGGLPALAIGVCFVIFMLILKSQAKKDAALQAEREKAQEREAEQYNELMKAYEQIVHEFMGLTKETAIAITRLSERVGSCLLKGVHTHTLKEENEDG